MKILCSGNNFRWSSNDDPTAYNNWASSEPSNLVAEDDCVHLWSAQKWKVGRCSTPHFALCQHPTYPGKSLRPRYGQLKISIGEGELCCYYQDPNSKCLLHKAASKSYLILTKVRKMLKIISLLMFYLTNPAKIFVYLCCNEVDGQSRGSHSLSQFPSFSPLLLIM